MCGRIKESIQNIGHVLLQIWWLSQLLVEASVKFNLPLPLHAADVSRPGRLSPSYQDG